MKTTPVIITLLAAAALAGCGTTTSSRTMSGTAAGAAAGAAIGSMTANAGKGAAIGAVVGGIGSFAYDQHQKELQQQQDREAWRASQQRAYEQQQARY
ncbi:MAG: hypothetical protein EOM91_03815 [Sphingobacteriia bacterium]|nr:hypothetical protein [Sphingobacteriia bacterium]NCC38425.1 hypothetical protein [Gammaproteobacteria bacterium]